MTTSMAEWERDLQPDFPLQNRPNSTQKLMFTQDI